MPTNDNFTQLFPKMHSYRCASQSYIRAQQKKLTTLQDLEKGALVAIAQAENAIDAQAFWGWMTVGAQSVKLIADLVFKAAAKKANIILPGSGEAAEFAYDYTKIAASSVAQGSTAAGTNAILKKQGMSAAKDALQKKVPLYKTAIGQAFDLYSIAEDLYSIGSSINDTMEGGSGIHGAKNALQKQLLLLRQKIDVLKTELSDTALCNGGPINSTLA